MTQDELEARMLAQGIAMTAGCLVWEADFARLLGSGRRTIERMRERGEVMPKSVRVGKKRAYPVAAVLQFLNGECSTVDE